MQPIQTSKKEIIYELWHRGNLSYKLDALQLHIRDTLASSKAPKATILSSRQIGKSFVAVLIALEFLIQNPGKIARVIGPTLKAVLDIIQDNMAVIIADAPPDFIQPLKSNFRWLLSNGSSLRLGALERAHVDGNRGGNASLVIYEEPGFVNGDDFNYGVNSVLGPQLLRSKGREYFISSPSKDPLHPLHTRLMFECQELGSHFAYTVYDSPSITASMIEEAIRRCGGEHTDDFQREYMARIIRPQSSMVIPDYNEAHHVAIFDLPTEAIMQMTVDWGGVKDKTVGLVHTYNYLADEILIWDEIVSHENTPTDIIVKALKEKERGLKIQHRYADVPGQTQVDLIDTHKYDMLLPQKSDWKASVQTMQVVFSLRKIKIHPRCKFLRQSCHAGMLNKTRSDFERSELLGHCDALAALMYAIRMQDRANPYQKQGTSDNFMIMRRDESELEKLANIGGKRFGNFR